MASSSQGSAQPSDQDKRNATWQRLFGPPEELHDPGDRRQVVLLALLLFILTLACVVGVLVRWLVTGQLGLDMVMASGVLAGAYTLSRRRRRAAAALGLFALSFPSFVVAYQMSDTDPDMMRHALIWLALPLFFSSFVLPVKETIAASTLIVLGSFAIAAFLPPAVHVDILMANSVLVVVSGLSIGAAVVHHIDRKTIKEQLERREFVEDELRAAKAGLEENVAEQTADLQEANERLRHSEKMEAIGQLAGGVAHDFNNLLTVITGYTQVALDELADNEPLHDDLREVLQAGERASALTRQLLAFGRRQVLRPKALDLNEVLDGMGRMLRRLLSEDVALELKPRGELWMVQADPTQIEQVVLNLVVNAGDAMPRGGTLTIRTRNVEELPSSTSRLDATLEGPHVMLAVSDSGEGMAPDVRDRIFEPFFTTKGPGKGTGLGLATVYGIVTQSGGTIEVESEPGEGTTFRVFLPKVEPGAEAIIESKVPPPRGIELILVVEDEQMVRDLTARMLTGLGYEVVTAQNGAAAVEGWSRYESAVQLIVTDVVMPEMGGPECVSRLRELGATTPVLYMSGHAEGALDARGALDGGVRLLHKPFDVDALANAVRDTLDDAGAHEQGRPAEEP